MRRPAADRAVRPAPCRGYPTTPCRCRSLPGKCPRPCHDCRAGARRSCSRHRRRRARPSPATSCLSVVLTRCATAPGQRPWCDSPQPTIPASVVTFTITASRFTARPMPSVTLFLGSTGNDVGKALMSTMRRLVVAFVMVCLGRGVFRSPRYTFPAADSNAARPSICELIFRARARSLAAAVSRARCVLT